jgi:hypothetical protein
MPEQDGSKEITVGNNESTPAQSTDEMVSKAKAEGYLTQAKEQKTRAEQLQAELQQYKDAEAAKQQAELEKKGEFEKLIATVKEENATLQDQIKSLQLTNQKGQMDRALLSENVTNEFTRKGMISEYLSLEAEGRPEFADWVAPVKRSLIRMRSRRLFRRLSLLESLVV